MSTQQIQSSPNPPLGQPTGESIQAAPKEATGWQRVQVYAKAILTPIASLRVTVVLFSFSLVLVFLGTLAQTQLGMWTAVERYFRAAIVWVPLQLFVKFGQVFFGVSPEATLAGHFPFPGGWLLGGLLLANLLAAHLVRFKLSWRRSGILLIHAGLVVMMLSELITGLFAVESHMTIATGETVNFIEADRYPELIFIDSTNPKFDDVVTVPTGMLKKQGTIRSDELPADVEVVEYMVNAALVPAKTKEGAVFKAAVGARFRLESRPEESGTSSQPDFPSIRVRFLDKKTGKPLSPPQADPRVPDDLYTLSYWFQPNRTQRLPVYRFPPQQVRVGDKTYTVELRPRRIYKPYSINLIKFEHKVYIGTEKAKDYASTIRLTDPSRKESRQVKIAMNEPLRYNGETFYQSGVLGDDKGTVLQVVRNPGWLMPYISCAMVSIGMLIHFGLHLLGFLRRRAV